MSDWPTVILIGAGTYAMRLSFIGIFGNRPMPLWAQRPLRLVAPAVLAALVLPAVLLAEGRVDLSPAANPRLAAAAVAGAVAWRLRNMTVVIVVGMGALWALQRAL